ncbi:Uncharacterised protein [Streptococcus downei MFe28]|uniref:Uncharacterized protein n=1 Tax=Streptococcus downei MFe28 TaxID=764290 RepID=A0A380JFF8_STRDO|nr:Uncharacterised protein [Streptococcus downei MFe28]
MCENRTRRFIFFPKKEARVQLTRYKAVKHFE